MIRLPEYLRIMLPEQQASDLSICGLRAWRIADCRYPLAKGAIKASALEYPLRNSSPPSAALR